MHHVAPTINVNYFMDASMKCLLVKITPYDESFMMTVIFV